MSQHFLLLAVTAFRFDNPNQLNLVELVYSDHAASAYTRCSRLASKARCVGAVIDWQLLLGEDFLAVNIGNRRFSRRDQIQLSESAGVQALPDCVVLIGKFRKLTNTLQALRPDHKWRRHLGITMLT